MRLALDATYSIGHNLTGVGVYCREMLWGIAALDPSAPISFLYRPHRILASFKEQLPANAGRGLLLETLGRRDGLFHGLNQRLPQRSFRKQVVTFHDLFVLTAEYSTLEFRRRFAEQARHAAASADVIIAVSEFTAGQIRDLLGVPASRIQVVHHGVRPGPPPSNLRAKVILHVGAIQTRKNLVRLVTAFAAAPEDWRLVLAGGSGFGAETVYSAIEESPARERITVTGYVDKATLTRCYAEASVFAFPSLDEGFGMPVLEAMAAGVPVIASNRGALPEVCGDAAVMVDALDTRALAQNLNQLCSDAEFRKEMAERGTLRATQFSWSRAVAQTQSVYNQLQ